jgi:hypothetical protein
MWRPPGAVAELIARTWRRSGGDDVGPYAAGVAFVAAILAGAAGVALWWNWTFEFDGRSDVRGWVWAHRYPKQQDSYAYALAIVTVAAGALAGRAMWCALTVAWLRLRPRSIEQGLRESAVAAALLLLLAPLIAAQAWSALRPLWPPLLAGAALAMASGLANSPPHQPRRGGWAAGVVRWAVIPACLYVYAFDVGPILGILNLFEDGASLAPLQSSLRGGEVYRDAYLQHGLLHNLGKPLFASLFDTSLTGVRQVDGWFAPLGCIALYFLGLAVFRATPTAVAAALVAGYQTAAISDRQAFGFIAIALIALAVRRATPSPDGWAGALPATPLFAAGACSGLAFFHSVDVGLFAGAACGAFLAVHAFASPPGAGWRRFGALARFGAGAGAATTPFLAYFAARGVLGDFADNIAVQVAYQADLWGRPFPPLAAQLEPWRGLGPFTSSRVFAAYLPPILYVGCAGSVAYRATRPHFWRAPTGPILLLITLAAVAWFRTVLGRFDPFHLAAGTPFLWIVVLLFTEHVFASLRHLMTGAKHRVSTAVAAAAGLALVAAGSWAIDRSYSVAQSVQRRAGRVAAGQNFALTLATPGDRLGGIVQPESMVTELRSVVRRIRSLTGDDDFIFDLTNQGALYFLADRKSPSRYQQIVYAATRALEREVIADLERTKPALVIYSASGPIASYHANIDGVASRVRNPEIFAYVERNYRHGEDVAGTALYLRVEE